MAMSNRGGLKDGGGNDARSRSAEALYPSQTFVPGELSPLRDCKFGASSAKVLQHQRSRDRLCILGDRK